MRYAAAVTKESADPADIAFCFDIAVVDTVFDRRTVQISRDTAGIIRRFRTGTFNTAVCKCQILDQGLNDLCKESGIGAACLDVDPGNRKMISVKGTLKYLCTVDPDRGPQGVLRCYDIICKLYGLACKRGAAVYQLGKPFQLTECVDGKFLLRRVIPVRCRLIILVEL